MLALDYPAAVVAGNMETSQGVTNVLFGALGVMAAAQRTGNNLSFGNPTYQYYETIGGGSGAVPGFHGASAVQIHMTNSHLRTTKCWKAASRCCWSALRSAPAQGGVAAIRVVMVRGVACDLWSLWR